MIAHNMEGDSSYDLKQLEEKVDADIEQKNREGYKVRTVTPITGSSYSDLDNQSYGQSFTIAVLIVYEMIK